MKSNSPRTSWPNSPSGLALIAQVKIMEEFVSRLRIVVRGVTERLARVEAMQEAGDCESQSFKEEIRDLEQFNNQYARLSEEGEWHIAALVKLLIEFRKSHPIATDFALRVANDMVKWAGAFVTREQIAELITHFPEMTLNPQAGTN